MQFSLSDEIVNIFNMIIFLNIKKSAWYYMYKNFSRSSNRELESDKTSYQSYNQSNRFNYQFSARSSFRQINYSIATHFVNDEWEYDFVIDTYHVVIVSSHFLDHISRKQDNSHDKDDIYAN
jgi:hypothetical protein